MQITFPRDMKQNRFYHTTAVLQLSSDLLKLVTFGGCPSVPSNPNTEDDFPKLANTNISELSELEYVYIRMCVCIFLICYGCSVVLRMGVV